MQTVRDLGLVIAATAALGLTTPAIAETAGAPLKGIDVKLGTNPGSKPAARSAKPQGSTSPAGLAVSDPGAPGSKKNSK